METLIISAFPGTGKSTMYNKYKDKIKILDSDSSKFDKSNFPKNYIEHIKENLGKVDIILVSSHKEVREALLENDDIINNSELLLVYPKNTEECKQEYINRYKSRGSSEAFINLLNSNYEKWIEEMEEDSNNFDDCIELEDFEFITDYIPCERRL